MVQRPSGGFRLGKIIFRLVFLGFIAGMLAGYLFLLPTPTPAQASIEVLNEETTLQASSAITVYLPIIHRSPTPEEELVDLINAERSRQGITPPLQINPLLMQVAGAHSQDMINRNFFDHINPDGLDPGDRLTNAGYNWLGAGENIGGGFTTPQAMFNAWMSSPGHRAGMLSDYYTEVGIGYVIGGYYGHYWTADFAKPVP
jgi:uncharacterized protein YkwD